MNRRDLLKGAAATALCGFTRPAWAFGPQSRVGIAEIDLGPGTIARPNAWERLVHEVESTTSVEIDARPARVTADDPELFSHPIAAIVGDGGFAMPDDTGIEQLSRFLAYGGLLIFDETTGSDNSPFDDSVRKLVSALFPTAGLAPLPSKHSLYRAFFIIDDPVGRLARHRVLEGVTVDGTEGQGGWTPIVYCRNDLSGALERDASGRYPYSCEPGGEDQRREALKLGMNMVLYSLTTDYKQDQAHVKELIDSGRLSGEWDTRP
jgi:hypothetical protein